MEYLVGVEWPWTGIPGEPELLVVVTDDYEGFGPDLLAAWDGQETPIRKIASHHPLEAGFHYLHDCPQLLKDVNCISINLSTGYECYIGKDGVWTKEEV